MIYKKEKYFKKKKKYFKIVDRTTINGNFGDRQVLCKFDYKKKCASEKEHTKMIFRYKNDLKNILNEG